MTKLAVCLNGRTIEVQLEWLPQDGSRLEAVVNGRQVRVDFSDPEAGSDDLGWIIVGGRPLELTFDPCLRWIQAGGVLFPLEIHDLETAESWPGAGDGRVKAPIPGLITAVLVEDGQKVKTGQPLLILEAMKMENEIRSPRTGVVESVHITPGHNVAKGEILITIAD